jgi:hypothetical protein
MLVAGLLGALALGPTAKDITDKGTDLCVSVGKKIMLSLLLVMRVS